jgi:glutathione S-transferase
LIGKEAEADGSAKSPAYLRINPQGTVPTLIDPNSSPESLADGLPQVCVFFYVEIYRE